MRRLINIASCTRKGALIRSALVFAFFSRAFIVRGIELSNSFYSSACKPSMQTSRSSSDGWFCPADEYVEGRFLLVGPQVQRADEDWEGIQIIQSFGHAVKSRLLF